jgi:hypothetical protein
MLQLELLKKKEQNLEHCLTLYSHKLMKKLKSWFLTQLKTVLRKRIHLNIIPYQSVLAQVGSQEYF